MKSLNTKLVLCAFGIAMLATPAFAQRSHRQQQQLQDRSVNEVIVEGRVVGADPDPQIRTQLLREVDGLQGD